MATNFSRGDKVKILGDDTWAGKTGVVIKDGGKQNLGTRKLGKSTYSDWLQQWVVKLDNTGDEIPFFEGVLEKTE